MKAIGIVALSLMISLSVNASRLKAGDTVYGHNGNHLTGTIQKIFGDKAEVNWLTLNGRKIDTVNFWDCDKLYGEADCADGICVDDEVYGNNGNDLTGKVLRIFENSKVEVNWLTVNGRSIDSVNYWDAEKLVLMTDDCGTCH